jgi:hypothetical protein
VPIYVQTIANPKVCHAVLRRLTDLTGLSLDLSDVRTAGEYLNDTLDAALTQNPELRRFVEELQQGEGHSRSFRQDPVSASDTERIIRDVEDFLRRGQGGGEGQAKE